MYNVQRKWTTAKKSEYGGYIFDSKFEASHAADLDILKRAGEIKDYKKQVNIPLVVNGYKIGDYRIDFIVYHNDGTIEYVELKGVAFPVWRLKWKILEAMLMDNPNCKMTLINQGKSYRPHKIKKYV